MGDRSDAIRALQRAGEMAIRADAEKVTPDEVATALDAAWGAFVGDTGCIPDCFTIRGPRSTRDTVGVDFGYGNFAGMVADHINVNREARRG